MKTLFKKLFFVAILCTLSIATSANNLLITNVSRVGTNVTFTISWDNSWKSVTGEMDAAWVFVKWRNSVCYPSPPPANAFNHGNLTTPQIISLPALSGGVDAVPDNTGIILARTNTGTGPIPPTTITLSMAPPFPAGGNLEVRVFAIEMALVTSGSYYLGDGASSTIKRFGDGSNLNIPFQVTGPGAITVGTGAGQLYATGDAPAGNIPAAYPKAALRFFCMKTEINQHQYADFLNTISFAQAINRFTPGPDVTYSLGGYWPFYNAGGFPDRACADLNFQDLQAYLDWAALRPMTELEFEKTCRGPLFPVPGEYAWGNTNLIYVGTRINPACETVNNAPGNGICNYDNGTNYGTLRCGFLGPAGGNSRITMSAGYYGHLELSGNLWEHVINTDAVGLLYNGTRGDGVLSATGFANALTWPNPAGPPLGSGYRGGAWFPNQTDLPISCRDLIYFSPDVRYSNVGGRGCR